MRALASLAVMAVLLFASGCVVVGGDRCSSLNCDGCCNASGQCQSGTAAQACGSGGNSCAVCPGNFTCSLGSCLAGNSGGGFGGGSGGGFGGGSGGGFTGGGGGSSLASGNVSFLWNFSSQTCAQAAGVQSVHIAIPGQTLANAGVYPCNTQGWDGITLVAFSGGSYSFTIEGRGASGQVLYQGAGTFTVNGDVSVNVTLTPPSGPTSASVSWTFPPNGGSNTPNCSEAGVSTVQLTIDNGTPTSVPCAWGLATPLAQDTLSPGVHSLTLEAFDANDYLFYRKVGSLTVQAGSTFANSYVFDWAVGSLATRWTFSNGTTQLNCAQAGVTQMNVNLLDAANNYLYGNTGVDVPCVANTGEQGTVFPFLNGGAYTLFLQAYGTGNVLYQSNFTSPPVVNVVNGQFPVLDLQTNVVLLAP